MAQTGWDQLFANFDLAPSPRRYGIAITPRSGSTWLGDVLTRTDSLGMPVEYFNQEAAHHTIRRSGCSSLPEYFDYLGRAYQTQGVFGFQIDWLRLQAANDQGYGHLFESIDCWLFLRRKDLVAQSISLYKAKSSGVWHSHQVQGGAPPVEYCSEELVQILLMLMDSEYRFTQYFAETERQYLPLWYEDIVQQSPLEIGELFFGYLGLELSEDARQRMLAVEPKFRKIGDSDSDALAMRFSEEHAGLIDYCYTQRGAASASAVLQALPEYQSKAPPEALTGA